MPELLVGEYRVRPETGEVERAGVVVQLEPKSMAVLGHLIENQGEVVSREDLLEAVWPGVCVGDDSVTAAIIKIRRALNDDARAPSYVETLPKRGYRLIACVAGPAVVSTGDAAGLSPAIGIRTRRARRWTLTVAAALILAVAVGASLWFMRSSPDATAGSPSREGDRIVIFVAEFVNASQHPEYDYLARGIGESLLGGLARIPGFSVRRYDPKVSAAASDAYLLEGNVVRAGDIVRIDARLLDADRGEVVSVLRFDRPFTDLLAIEDEIRESIVIRLSGSISAVEHSRQAHGYTEDVGAYDDFLRAQGKLLIRTSTTNLAARAFYRRAIAADPNFARAYGGMALTYAAEYRNGWTHERRAALDHALKYARTALGIAPDLPEQHWVFGYVLTQQRRYDEARAELDAAIALDPDFADAFALSGGIETYRGNPAATVPLLREAMRLNPDAGHLYFMLLARAYYFLGDFDQAEINLGEALARNPENLEAHLYLAATLLHLGRRDDAAWEVVEVQNVEPDFRLANWGAHYPMARGAQFDRLVADLRAVGLS